MSWLPQRFGRNVKSLDKLQASGLIEELFDMTGKKNGRAPRRNAYGEGGGDDRPRRITATGNEGTLPEHISPTLG